MRKSNIILTGFMGTGKSTVGRILAARLNYEFVDTDIRIEVVAGRTIREIFAEEGEVAFRAMERRAAEALAKQECLIISTGGGMMIDDVNAAVLGKTGHVFCLTASAEEILARVSANQNRPLLQVKNPAQRIRDLLAARAEKYGRFEQVETGGRSAEQVAAQIIASYWDGC